MTFSTERLPLAVYLHATNRLKFLNCEQSAQAGRLAFVFEDNEGAGAAEQLAFDFGAVAPAVAIFASLNFLRKLMTSTLKNYRSIVIDKSE